MAMYDEDVAWKRCSRMWQKVARLLEASAYQAAEQGLVQKSITTAAAAESAFWQATGSSDIASLKDFVAPSTHQTGEPG